MFKLLLGGAAVATVLLLSQPTKAAIISDLGINPTSTAGAFSASVGGGAFETQHTFQLVGGPQFVTIASATNVYPNATDFIVNFAAALWNTGANGIVNDGDDQLVLGPVAATPCLLVPNCQIVSGSALLNPGNYYLEFTGLGGGTSGYGGNLAVSAVPGPAMAGGLPGLVAAALGFLGWHRSRRRPL